LHGKGFIHGDLTIGNVLLDARLGPWLVDLDRGRTTAGPVAWRGAVEDFFRFARHVPTLGPGARFGALRLLKAYCRERGWLGRERDFAADILKRLKQKVKGYGADHKRAKIRS
jgi:tRNA A-37 threonylcarbamoyl transferase component Bud32